MNTIPLFFTPYTLIIYALSLISYQNFNAYILGLGFAYTALIDFLFVLLFKRPSISALYNILISCRLQFNPSSFQFARVQRFANVALALFVTVALLVIIYTLFNLKTSGTLALFNSFHEANNSNYAYTLRNAFADTLFSQHLYWYSQIYPIGLAICGSVYSLSPNKLLFTASIVLTGSSYFFPSLSRTGLIPILFIYGMFMFITSFCQRRFPITTILGTYKTVFWKGR